MYRLKEIFKDDDILLNTIYESDRDFLVLTMKNALTGRKKLISLPHPEVPIYITKDPNPKEYKEFAKKDEVVKKYVPHKFREYNIARELGIKNFAKLVREGKMESKDIYLNKRLFGADNLIEDAVMKEYCKHYTIDLGNNNFETNFPRVDSFHIGGLDIETDITVSDDPLEQPVIVNTYVDGKTWTVYSECLINDRFNGQKEIMEDLDKFKKELNDFLINHIESISMGNKDKEKAIKNLITKNIKNMKYVINFRDNDLDVIKNINKKVFSEINPDFLLIYNAQYDINHQVNRVKHAYPKFRSDDLFKYKNEDTYTYINTRNQNTTFSKRFHYFDFHNPTKVVDQMLLYYQLRKANIYDKFSLDATCNRELGIGKLDYSKICNFIGDFPYVDYKSFLIYNIIDVLAMLFLDLVTNDIMSIVYTRFSLATEWNKVNVSLPSTTNAFDFYNELQGFIPANNINPLLVNLKKENVAIIEKNNPGLINVIKQLKKVATSKKEENPYRIEGGLVTSPNLIDDRVKDPDIYKIGIKTYNKFGLCADLDATSMYPSNIEANNGSKTTLIGRIEKLNGIANPKLGRNCALSIINNNIASIGHYYFNLPKASDLIHEYYGITPIKKEVKSTFYNEEEEVKLDFTTNKKQAELIKKLYRNCYNTSFDDKDTNAGAPSVNKLFFTSDDNKIEFSYYDTKIEIESNIPFNEVLGVKGAGFICGHTKESTIYNLNHEYKESLLPTKETFNTKFISSGSLTDTQLEEIRNAKRVVYKLILDNYEYSVINRLIFYSDKINKKIDYEIYDIIEDSNLFKIKFKSQVESDGLIINITQSIVAYKLQR